jgi:branched-chain amino acid transport system substrate-binding protein
MSAEARAWSERYTKIMRKLPSSGQGCAYSSTMHWLKAVQAVGSLDADAVTARMHETPVTDFFNAGVRIMPTGSVPHTMYL